MNADSPVDTLARIDSTHKKALEKLGVITIRDLLYHFPTRYENVGEAKRASESEEDELVTLYGTVSRLKTRKAWKSRVPMAEGVFTDTTGSVHLVWFNQPYITKMIPEGSRVSVEGVIKLRNEKKVMQNPKIEIIDELPSLVGELPLAKTPNEEALNPVYPTSKGATSFYLAHLIKRALNEAVLNSLEDPVPEHIREKYNLPSLKTALVWIHFPKNLKDAESAKKRIAFEEILSIQVDRQRERLTLKKHNAFSVTKTRKDIQPALDTFGFSLTEAQERSISGILEDLKKDTPMSRLLEGDVGSGKTVVAASAIYATVTTYPKGQDFGSLQAAYMVPTEILAEQQFQSFCSLLKDTPLSVGLITSSGCKKFPSKINPEEPTPISRRQLLAWVENGEIAVVIGTHSLIQKSVQFKHLALVVIDEQHRFGTKQRKNLLRKDAEVPHLLSMTATPIPRTLALTIYGDLDLTLLDEAPKGRKPVITEVVPPNKRDGVYEHIRKEIQSGRQAYVLCPRIDDPDPSKENAITAKSVTEEAKRLREKVFPELSIGEMHGKMTPKKKDEVMRAFARGDIDILVTTSVVEVGVNVPNATSIIIEGAERFGLAQLHQLRGRVVRSHHQAYCFIFSESYTDKTKKRLSALTKAKNGFELAEYDLELRGAGDLYGRKQSGMTDIGMEAIKNIKMVEAAREEAKQITAEDSSLKKYPALRRRVEALAKLHME